MIFLYFGFTAASIFLTVATSTLLFIVDAQTFYHLYLWTYARDLNDIRSSVASRHEDENATDMSLKESTQRMSRARGPMDSFTTSQTRNSTLNSK